MRCATSRSTPCCGCSSGRCAPTRRSTTPRSTPTRNARSSGRVVGLFNRSSGVAVTVTPDVAQPRQVITVTVTADKPIDKVTSARLEWGYDNFYRYHWAGRADSAVAAGNDSLWTAGQVGTNYGGERDTDDWVNVTTVDIPIATGEFDGTTATFTVPSWAP